MSKEAIQKVRDILDNIIIHMEEDVYYGVRHDYDIAHTNLNEIEKEIDRLLSLADSERARADHAIMQLSGSPF